MLKVPIISGRSKRVRSNNCITLLCTSQFTTNLKPGLGTYWEIYTSRLCGLYLSHHVIEDSITGLGPEHAWDEILHSPRLGHRDYTQSEDKTTSLPRTLCSKSIYYSLDAFWYPLFPKLCRHNLPNPIIHIF